MTEPLESDKRRQVESRRDQPFYGWYIVAVSFAAGIFSAGTMNIVFSVMLKPMAEDLGWGRAALTGAGSLGVLAASLVSPVFGRLVDLRGPRLIASLCAAGVGLALVLVSRMNAVWQFYVLYGLARVISYNGLQLIPSTTVANWFVRARARAVSIAVTGGPAGGAILAWIANRIALGWGWRSGWMFLGLATWICLLAPLAFILRRRPEDLGLLPDGASQSGEQPVPTKATKSSLDDPLESSWTPGQAIRSSVFWLLTLGLALGTLAIPAAVVHQVAYLADRGFPSGVGANAVVILAGAGAVSSIVWSVVADWWSAKYALMAAMSCVVLGVLLLLFAGSVPMVYVYAILLGLGGPGQYALQTVLYGAHFGRLNLGSIRGMASPFVNLGWAMGPLVAAWVYDSTQSYQFIFAIFGSCSLMGMTLIALSKGPRRISAPADAKPHE